MNTILRAIAVATILVGAAKADTYNLVVQPIYTPERAQEVYAPLTEYLTRVTPHTFNLVVPKNFHHYWADMRRRDDWHFVFDDAHFTDYRVQKFGYTPLVKTVEPVSFTLLGGYEITDEKIEDLVGRRIVTMPAPSLGFALLSKWYNNPLRQPIIVSSASSWRDTVEIVFAAEADAAMVPTWLAERYPNLLPMGTSEELPGAAISAASGVPEGPRDEVREALLALHEDTAAYEVLVELNVTQFENTSAEEYAGFADLLRSFYGF